MDKKSTIIDSNLRNVTKAVHVPKRGMKHTPRIHNIMECYCLHNSVIKEWRENAVQSDTIVRYSRRFPCQYLHYFT